ncbi:MAG: isoprenylcysteine carboxylmethyltransferase family protein [Pseudomonadota bacterium]|nr:MAG: isoprenylcysteine carboxylmethyltransferase family protein [Pseudomonadota bacterium]
MLASINAFFNNPTARRLFLKSRWVIAVAALLLIAVYAKREWLWWGLGVSLVGELIQVWAFAALVKNEELTARGPYVLVRNPMYLGRLIMMLGLVLLLGNPYIAGAFFVLYYFYMVNRVAREERRLAPLLGAPYAEYCYRTNRFMPTFSRLTDPNLLYFNWRVLVRNNGQWNLLANLVIYAALAIYITQLR